MQNSVISTRITGVYGSQPSSVFFACQTAPLGPELQVSMGPRPHLSCFVHAKQRDLHQNNKSHMGSSPHLWVLCMQNSAFRTRITSLCRWREPIYGFCMQNSDFWTRITSLYGSQTSPVIFCMQNSVPSIRITSLHGSQPSSVVFACKTATFGSE